MKDIAPGLLAKIEAFFRTEREQDAALGFLLEKIQAGSATYQDVAAYAQRLGEILAEVLKTNISADILPDGRMYFNIADRVLGPLLREDHELITDAAAVVQESMNRAAGLRLRALRPTVNADRIEGIVTKISDAEKFDTAAWMLDEPVINFSRAVVDDTIRENVEFHARAGLRPTITRIAEGSCCAWCSRLAGKYDYPVDREIYQRHEYCRCLVLYDPGSGRVQGAHSKVSYASQAQAERDERVARAKALEEERASKAAARKR